jgi:hypothetical protein
MTATTTFVRYILKIIKRRSYVVHDDTHLTSHLPIIIDTARNKTKVANEIMCVIESKAKLFEFLNKDAIYTKKF